MEVKKINNAVITLEEVVGVTTVSAKVTIADDSDMMMSNGNINGGAVMEGSSMVATFSSASADNLNVSYLVTDAEKRMEALGIINDFCEEAREFADKCVLTAGKEAEA